jgi:tungstate transport system substrate-binding protein
MVGCCGEGNQDWDFPWYADLPYQLLHKMRRKPMRYRNPPAHLAVALLLVALAIPVSAAERFITVASTTSTENSGLFRYLLPQFQQTTGIEVRVVAVGTGQAIKNAERGDADVLFVHHQPSEEAFVAQGFGVARRDVMYNDYVLLGPQTDPAGIKGTKDAVAALARIAATQAPFVSRGDDSGTHKLESSLWQAAGIDVKKASGSWYREAGSGMGATLNTASGLDGYTISDRGTWISFKNKGTLTLLVEGDPRLFNQYGVILVNPAKHAHVKAEDGQAFIDWLTSDQGQKAIADFRIEAQQLFFPNAKKGGS